MNLAEQISRIVDLKLRLLKLDANKAASIASDGWTKTIKGVTLFVQPTEPSAAVENDVWVDSDYAVDSGRAYFNTGHLYQHWTDYPPSPVLTSEYPYQYISNYAGTQIRLYYSPTKMYRELYDLDNAGGASYRVDINTEGGGWLEPVLIYSYNPGSTYEEANNDVYTDATLTTPRFAKTTTTLQDGGVEWTLISDGGTSGAVDSVNGETGAVVLDAGDIDIVDSGGHFTAIDVEGALSELFTSVSDGKTDIAASITGKGGTASGSDTFAELADAIDALSGGTYQSKTVTPNASGQTVSPDMGYDALSSVVINGDADLTVGNVKTGVTIFGVTGTYAGEAYNFRPEIIENISAINGNAYLAVIELIA